MNYDHSKTSTENYDYLIEQQNTTKPNIPQLGDWKNEYLKSHPYEVWDPNITKDEQVWDSQGNLTTKKVKVGGFVPLTLNNIKLRDTPFGFHPKEYPEYLKKLKDLKKKYDEMYKSPENTKGSDYFLNQQNQNIKKLFNNELTKLKKEYYHEDFPYGITKEDYNDWIQAKSKIANTESEEYKKLKNEFAGMYKSPENTKGSDYFLNLQNQNIKNLESLRTSQIKQSFESLNDYIDAVFENDPTAFKEINKSWLEKQWDKYGWAAEFLMWVVADIFSEGWLIPLTEIRQAYVLSKILKVAFRSGLPVSVGIARNFKEGYITENSVIDFVFAILPWAHSYFAISKKPTIELVESIISKKNGIDLKKIEDVKKYIKNLTEEEKYFFKKFSKLSKKEIDDGLSNSLKEIEKIGEKVLSTSGKKIKPSIIKKVGNFLGRAVFIDLPAIEISKIIARKFGFLDQNDKIEALKNKFQNKNGEDLLILLSNAIKVLKTYPNLSIDDTIKKINEREYVKTADAAIKVLSDENLIMELLIDQNGNSIK